MMQQIQNKPLTPLEKLISDKERIRKQCVIQEQKLNDDFSYIQENAGSLLISGFTTLLFPNTKSKKTESTETATTATAEAKQQEKSRHFGAIKNQRECILNDALPLLAL